MGATLDKLAAHFDAMGVRYHRSGSDRLETGWTTAGMEIIGFLEQGPLLTVIAPRVATVPQRKIDDAIALANRLNASRVRWGAFWVDAANRTVGFELALPVASADNLTAEIVGLILVALRVIPSFYPAFARVIWVGVAADAPFEELLDQNGEGDDEDETDEDLSEAV